jgi:hypothetical protein
MAVEDSHKDDRRADSRRLIYIRERLEEIREEADRLRQERNTIRTRLGPAASADK